ncbi:unnamed protein product, partial [marine sediment metagenome]
MIFNGEYRVVGVVADNVYDFLDEQPCGSSDDGVSFVMQRFRINTIAATENVKGVLGFEIGWDEWGKSYGSMGKGTIQAGGDTGVMVDYAAANMEVRLAYIDFTFPGTGVSLSAGKQSLFSHQHLILLGAAMSPGIQLKVPLNKGSQLKLFWAKLVEGVTATSFDQVGAG